MITNLLKMSTVLSESNVNYSLSTPEKRIDINSLIGKEITIEYKNEINCIHCGKKTKKSFGQGYCYPCFTTVPEADPSIIKPELDQSHLGIARDMEWAKKNSLVDHYVYLAFSGGLKVGVTRATQIPTRWIDQGATRAIVVCKTPNRYLAGVTEVELKKHFADKTNWRKMLTNFQDSSIDLFDEKRKALNLLPDELKEFSFDEQNQTDIKYPVLEYPKKVTSIGLDKKPIITETLIGIRGQYLIFGNNTVFNIRKHSGYKVEIWI